MSKASEYAARVAAAEVKPEPFQVDGAPACIVNGDGRLWFCSYRALDPEEAFKLVDWIYEMFGEKKS